MRRGFDAARVIAVNAVVLAALLGGLEAAVRVAHPEIRPSGVDRRLVASDVYGASVPAPRVGASGEAMGVVRHVDARGLWRTRHARPARPAWLFLGDSVTMGIGVADDSTFVARLGATVDSLDVQNAALVGYDAADYPAVLRGRLARADGDRLRRVTLVWCLNDVYAGRPVAGVPGGGRVLESRAAAWARRHVRTVTWAKATFADRPLAYARFDAGLYAPGQPHLPFALAHLDTLIGTTRRAGLTLDVALVPYEAQVRTPQADRLPQRLLAAALAARDVPVLDLAPAFAAAPDPRRLYHYGDGLHLSDAGHRLVAEVLHRWRPR